MFSKKEETPPLAIFQLEYNFSAISEWVKNKAEIPPDHEWDIYDVTRKHTITMLPMDTFLFYHNDVNEFSPAIAGGHSLNGNDFFSIDWDWHLTHFRTYLDGEGDIIFLAPLEEIMYLLKHRESKDMFDDWDQESEGGVLVLGFNDGYCRQIYYQSTGQAAIFSNSLFKLSVVCVTASNRVIYPDA